MSKPVPQDNLGEQYHLEKISDEENAMHDVNRTRMLVEAIDAVQSWQPREYTSESRRNETKRAHYDLYPKTWAPL